MDRPEPDSSNWTCLSKDGGDFTLSIYTIKSSRGANRETWGADADHLKTPEDVQYTAAAGFVFFTIDPSSYVNNSADSMVANQIKDLARQLEREELFHPSDYLGKSFDLGESQLTFTEETLHRAAVKYGRAIAHSANMTAEILRHRADADIEISVDETNFATTPIEHLFIAKEFQRRGVKITGLAPRFVGEFEKGVDYKGDIAEFERQLRLHLAIAKVCGPHKISIHSGSDKFSVYPAIGRICEDFMLRRLAPAIWKLFARFAEPTKVCSPKLSPTRTIISRQTAPVIIFPRPRQRSSPSPKPTTARPSASTSMREQDDNFCMLPSVRS